MTILKTYARLFVADTARALPLYEALVGHPADLRFTFEQADLAAVGDFLLIGGSAADTAQYRGTVGPVVVDDVEELVRWLAESGAQVDAGPLTSATGTFYYITHADGAVVEYVQWTDELVERVFGSPSVHADSISSPRDADAAT